MLAVFTAPTAEGFSPHLRNPCTQQNPSLLCFTFVQQGHTVEAAEGSTCSGATSLSTQQASGNSLCNQANSDRCHPISDDVVIQPRQPKPQPNPDKVLACPRLAALWERVGRIPASDITCHEGADGAMSPKLLLQVWSVQSWGCFWENSNFEKSH